MKNKFMVIGVFVIGMLMGSLVFPKSINTVSANGKDKVTKTTIMEYLNLGHLSSSESVEVLAKIEYLKLENIESQTKILRSIEKHLKDAASSLKDIAYKMNY